MVNNRRTATTQIIYYVYENNARILLIKWWFGNSNDIVIIIGHWRDVPSNKIPIFVKTDERKCYSMHKNQDCRILRIELIIINACRGHCSIAIIECVYEMRFNYYYIKRNS